MKWLIMRGSRFYDVAGILVLALAVESVMNGIARIKQGYTCLLCFVATVFWLISGWLIMEVVHILQVYETERVKEGIYDDERVYELMVQRQAHTRIYKRIVGGLILSLLAIGTFIAANLCGKS